MKQLTVLNVATSMVIVGMIVMENIAHIWMGKKVVKYGYEKTQLII